MPISIYDGTTWQKISSDVATKLANPRTITLSGVTATGQLFDGTADVTIPITAVPATLLTGTASINTTGSAGSINGTQNGVTTTINAENSSYTYYKTSSTDGHYFNKDLVVNGAVYPYRDNVSDVRNLGLSNAKWDNVYATTFNGNATSATVATSAGQLTSTRNITLTGMVSGTTTTNLSSDITINTNVQAATISNAGIVTTSDQTFAGAKHFPQGLSSYSIEFTDIASTASNGGYIDFHYNGSTADYTSRIIEDASGRLTIYSINGIRIFGNISPDATNTRTLGTDNLRYSTGYINHVVGYTDAAASPTYMAIPNNANLNNYQIKGHYICGGDAVATTVVNNPTGGLSFAMDVIDVVSENNSSYKMQIAYQYNNGYIYTRIFISSAWSAWQRLARMEDIPGLASASNNGLISTGTQTIAGIKTFSSGIITPSIITSLSEYYTALGNVSGSLTIAFVSSAKNIVTMTCTAATTLSFTQTGAYSSGANTYTLIITNGGGRITWPSTVKWADGTPPDLTASGVDIITLLSLGGANLYYGVAATNFA